MLFTFSYLVIFSYFYLVIYIYSYLHLITFCKFFVAAADVGFRQQHENVQRGGERPVRLGAHRHRRHFDHQRGGHDAAAPHTPHSGSHGVRSFTSSFLSRIVTVSLRGDVCGPFVVAGWRTPPSCPATCREKTQTRFCRTSSSATWRTTRHQSACRARRYTHTATRRRTSGRSWTVTATASGRQCGRLVLRSCHLRQQK